MNIQDSIHSGYIYSGREKHSSKIDIETFFLYSYSFCIPILFNPSFLLVACWHLLLEIDTPARVSWYTFSCLQRHLAGNSALSWAIALFTSIPKHIYILPLGFKFLAFSVYDCIHLIFYTYIQIFILHYLIANLMLYTLQENTFYLHLIGLKFHASFISIFRKILFALRL